MCFFGLMFKLRAINRNWRPWSCWAKKINWLVLWFPAGSNACNSSIIESTQCFLLLLKNATAYMINRSADNNFSKIVSSLFPENGRGASNFERSNEVFVLWPSVNTSANTCTRRLSSVQFTQECSESTIWRDGERVKETCLAWIFFLPFPAPIILRWLIRSWALQPTRKIRDSFQMLTLITCN